MGLTVTRHCANLELKNWLEKFARIAFATCYLICNRCIAFDEAQKIGSWKISSTTDLLVSLYNLSMASHYVTLNDFEILCVLCYVNVEI